MVLQSATIIFNDSCSRYNKDLVDYLRRNIETAIRKGGVSFNFKIAQTADLAGLRRKGIKALPAMTIGKQNYVSVPTIIAELRKRVKNSTSEATIKSEDEIINDYQMQAMYGSGVTKDSDGKFVVSNDPEKDEGEELQSAFNQEIKRRGASAGYGANNENDDDDDRPRRPKMRKPSRDADRDDLDMDEDEPPVKRRAANQQRPDNVEDNMDEARESLKRIGRHATGDDLQDDTMMNALLDRMGSD